MPFTVSHVIAVLPLATPRFRGRLVPSGLVIGAMIPDWPYFFPPRGTSGWTHAAYGPVSIDLLLGLAAVALWVWLIRSPMLDLAPTWLRTRLGDLPTPSRTSVVWWLTAALSVIIGALTHVTWDTFTHPNRWGTTHLPALTEVFVGPLPLYKWLQYGSSVLGMAGIVTVLSVWWRRAAHRSAAPTTWSPRARHLAWAVLVLAPATTALLSVLVPGWRYGDGFDERTIVRAVFRSFTAAGIALLTVCAVWWSVRRSGVRRRRPQPGR